MREWKETQLEQVTTKIGSGATPRGGSNEYKDEGISLIRSQNVLDLKFSYNGLAFIDGEQAKALNNVIVESDDVLLNITGDSVARACKVIETVLPARVNQHVAIIRADTDKLVPAYLLYNLIFQKEELLSQSEIGATRKAITKGMIEKFQLLLPPLLEQRAIASVLSSLDDKIDLLHRQNKTLEAMAETLFRQWFVEEESKLCNITELVNFNPKRQLAKNSIAPYLEMANVSTTVFHPEDWYDREFKSGTKFINGDTLLARITPCLENGKSSFVTFLTEGQVGWGSTEYIVLRSKEQVHPLFTYALARNDDFRGYAEGCLEGSSGRQRVNVDHLQNYEVYMPDSDKISQFNDVAASIVPKLDSNFRQVRSLEKMRDTLLPKMMSGEVRITV